jgi:hypothetical protein
MQIWCGIVQKRGLARGLDIVYNWNLQPFNIVYFYVLLVPSSHFNMNCTLNLGKVIQPTNQIQSLQQS